MLSVKEVAARASVSVKTVRRWRQRGLRSIQHGRILRFHVDDVDAFLRANSTTLTSEGAPTPPAVPPSATP